MKDYESKIKNTEYQLNESNKKIKELEQELKAADDEIDDMKKNMQDDTFLRNMIKAQNAELKIRNLSESNIPKTDPIKDNKNKVEMK